MLAPGSRIGPITADERRQVMGQSLVAGHYEQVQDRESAYEKLKSRAAAASEAGSGATPDPARSPAPKPSPSGGSLTDLIFGSTGPRGGRREGIIESAARSAARSIGSSLGRSVLRGMFGTLRR